MVVYVFLLNISSVILLKGVINNIRGTKLIFDLGLLLPMILLFISVHYDSIELVSASILLGGLFMTVPILASRILCLYYMKRAKGFSQYVIQGSYLLIVLAGVVSYLLAYIYPPGKGQGFEFIFVPLSQLMSIVLAILLSVLLKNSSKIDITKYMNQYRCKNASLDM